MYYRAEGKAVCGDVIPFYEDGRFYLFYLKDFRDIPQHGEGCPWYLITTGNLVDFEEHGEVLCRGSADDQDLYVFTGSCFKYKNEYFIFYTGHNPHKRSAGLPEEKIMLAKSRDLIHWQKEDGFALEAPEWLEMHDFRDPFVYYDDEKKRFCMLAAARMKCSAPASGKGITAILTSDDLYHWEMEKKPFYAPYAYFTHECPDLFRMGDWWYLIFSEFTDKVATTYRMSRSADGPWITPKLNTFDGHAFYAAKTASDGERRFLFGWNCIRNQEKDFEPWQWGGTIVPHELVQAEDGTLYVKCPREIRESCRIPVPTEDGQAVNLVSVIEGGYRIGGNGGMGLKMLGRMPENCRIEMDITTSDEVGDFGILLRADEHADQYYAVKFEPRLNRLAFDQVPRKELTVHIQADTERYCPMEPGRKHTLLIMVEGSVLECYVDDKIAMSARMFDWPEGNLAIYARNTQIDFTEILVFTDQKE